MLENKPIRLEMRIRNNRILKAVEDLGFPNVAQFCKKTGMGQTAVGKLVNFKESPLTKQGGGWRELALRMAKELAHAPEELWPDEIRHLEKASMAYVAIDTEEAKELSSTERTINAKRLGKTTREVLNTLTPKEQVVIEKRYCLKGEDQMDFQTIGELLGVGRQRAMQIEAKALRKLRHPKRARLLRPYTEG